MSGSLIVSILRIKVKFKPRNSQINIEFNTYQLHYKSDCEKILPKTYALLWKLSMVSKSMVL